ncbi:uncharacterized protein C1orf21-like [Montipora foliosa]|uniref:uncharacterized protein C1orf21-like n=1 Tax=Montipora foliosa TaxID=591990 RepID=UPI0035F1BAD1
MGCSAGKHLTTSPEVSSSSHTKENGHTSDVPQHSLESSSQNYKRKDSSNSISSIKEPDIPDAKHNENPVLSKDKNEERSLAKRPAPIRSGDSCSDAAKPIPFSQVRVQMTRSQIEFFRMLDEKIEKGPDYISETDS